jgi:multidrug efflux pump subunit AcrB
MDWVFADDSGCAALPAQAEAPPDESAEWSKSIGCRAPNIIIFQVRSIPAMVMVFLTSPLGLIGVVPTLILFQQPFGINALVGLIALSGILMRNTLILIGQIHQNEQEGLDPFHSVVEATVQRARPLS